MFIKKMMGGTNGVLKIGLTESLIIAIETRVVKTKSGLTAFFLGNMMIILW